MCQQRFRRTLKDLSTWGHKIARGSALGYNHAIVIRLDLTQTLPLVQENDRSSHQRAWRQVDDVARDGQDRLEEMKGSVSGNKIIPGRR